MMRTILNYMLAGALLTTGLASCSNQYEPGTELTEQGQPVNVSLSIGTEAMKTSVLTRAASPMAPEMENPIKTLAIFEFDSEGLHTKSGMTYHFINFQKGTLDGIVDSNIAQADDGVLDTKLDNITLKSQSSGTLCLVANATEEQITAFYADYKESGQTLGNIRLEQFKKWTLKFDYANDPEGENETAGHISQMYMFGYYEGAVDATTSGNISVTLGRLASRLDITFSNETGQDISDLLVYHFDNVCHEAYVFPGAQGVAPEPGPGITHTTVVDPENTGETFAAGATVTHYFYVAGNSASSKNKATTLHLFYKKYIPEDEGVIASIPLGNMPPDEAADNENGYWLNRNTLYQFTFHLKKATTSSTASSSVSKKTESVKVTRSSRPDGHQDITIFLL